MKAKLMVMGGLILAGSLAVAQTSTTPSGSTATPPSSTATPGAGTQTTTPGTRNNQTTPKATTRSDDYSVNHAYEFDAVSYDRNSSGFYGDAGGQHGYSECRSGCQHTE